jgi:hypothetical protein
MCQSCETKRLNGLSGQRTFGEIVAMEPVVPVMPHRDDLVVCEDSGERMERDDAIECADGTFYASRDNVADCPDCGDTYGCDVIDENDGHCETCRRDNYTECHACGDVIANDDRTTSECGDDYCESCYSDRFYSCDECGGEVHRDDVICRHGQCYCSESCAPYDDSGEREIPSWHGRNEYAKVGSRRKFGVELETSASDGWSEWVENTAFGAKDDGSVDGKEFVSPVLYGDDGLAAVDNLCNYAKRNDCRVNRSCGYHLHLDMSNESAEELRCIALAYAYTQEFWFACVDSNRRDNSYCHNNVIGDTVYWDVDSIKAGVGRPRPNTRYIWANWSAYSAHSTLEIRLHHGSLDGREVCNWIKAHARFVDYVKGLTVGQITRIFGNKTVKAQMRNMRDLWKDAELSDYYAEKAGVGCNTYAAA